jgi:hypothetical protein
MSLLKLYASDGQTDYMTHRTIYNINNNYDKQCQDCINNNTIPKLFYYYGPKLCSKICLPDYKSKYYNAMCDKGHIFLGTFP